MGEVGAAGRRRPPWGVVVVGLVVALAAAGIAVWATRASAASGYRTAKVTTATVRRTLSLSGNAEAVHQAVAAFQVSGTVSAVDVALNQQVTAGETIASLDTTTLEKDVTSGQSAVSSAQAKLTEDESTSTTTTTTVPSSTTTAAHDGAGTATATGTSGTAGLTQAQQAVVTAQQTADDDSTTAAEALTRAESTCAGPEAATTTTTPAPTPAATTDPSAACTAALDQALAAQQQVSADQKAVATAEAALATMLSSSSAGTSTPAGGSGSGSSSTVPASTGPASGGGSDSTGGGSSGGGVGSTSDSAAQLASDQAAIDSAKASLVEAQQSLADAQLTSPIDGTVASVALTVGQAVTAGSTADAVTIINSGSYQVTATLTTSQAAEVTVGDAATVSVNGTAGTLAGTVSRVGPVDTSSGYTYPLVVALPSGSHGIAAGSAAQVVIVVDQARDVLVVPTSAVHTAGTGNAFVETLVSGQEARKVVGVGVVGAVYTQITSGLSAGTAVVLADLTEAVPSSSSSTSTRFGALAGPGGTGARFSGGGGFAGGDGGFAGGGPAGAGAGAGAG